MLMLLPENPEWQIVSRKSRRSRFVRRVKVSFDEDGEESEIQAKPNRR